MEQPDDRPALDLTIIGRGIEVEKMHRRLRCAARATGTKLHFSWRNEYPQALKLNAEHASAVTLDGELVLDGLKPVEEIETVLTKLKNRQ